MHAMAQALAKARILQQHPGAHPAELKRLLFLHFYGTDFEPEQRKRIASALAKGGRQSEAEETSRPLIQKPLDLANSAITNPGGVRERDESYRGKKKGRTKRPPR
jgi:hypothetical protein